MTSFEVRHLNIDRGGKPILTDVSFQISGGSWCGLIGVNGAGKTTLLNALCGRIPLAEGQVLLDEKPLEKPRDRALNIGVSVAAGALPTGPKVGRLLDEVAKAHGQNARCDRLQGLWQALAMTEIEDRRIGILSAGQKQRLGLYLAFVGQAPVVLLDEPFNALDPLISYDLRLALKALAENGLIIITAMHDLATVALNCSQGLLVSNGRLVETYSVEDLDRARLDPLTFEGAVLSRWREAERKSL